MSEEQIPTIHEDPEDGGNAAIGCVGDDPHGPGGHADDEFVEPLSPPEDDPEGERAEEEELLEEPLPDRIEPEANDG